MFKRINLPTLDLNLDTLAGTPISSYKHFDEYKSNMEVFENLTFQIKPSEINLTKITSPGVAPHKDVWPVALNYYINAGKDSTAFWKSNINRNISNGPTIFNRSELVKVNEFVANTHDWYLFDTKVIHSVDMSKNSNPRFILRFIWRDHSFDEILKSLLL